MQIYSNEIIGKLKELRSKGFSISELMKRFSMPKTSVWHHIKDVEINKYYSKILRSKKASSVNRSLKQWELARSKARDLISSISAKEKIIIASCLYWGEGTKREFSLINSDPTLIKVFLDCIQELGITCDKLRVTLRIYEDIDREKALDYWSRAIGIKKLQISNINILRGKKNGKLKYGMCRIRVAKGAVYFKLIQSVIELIKTNFIAPIAQKDRAPES